jgi:two-component system response regulator
MTATPMVDVLLAEDNPSDAELILHSLTEGSRSCQVHVVHDGEEALDFLFCREAYSNRRFEDAPRVVLLDIKLPKVSGLEVLREVRADPRTRPVPIVLLTSSKLASDVAKGYRLGANSYVQKPVEFARFRETIRDLGRYWLESNEPPPAQVFMGESP